MTAVKLPEITPEMTKLEAALAYAGAGLYVLATLPGVKNPGSLVGGNWEKAATTDPAVLRGWFEGPAGERRGLGICPGPSGLVVLDIDKPEHPEAPAVAGAPRAYSRPGTDRQHVFVRQPQGRKIGCPKVPWGDVRGWGGFVMAAPSRNPDNDGQPYGPPSPGRVPVLPRALADAFPEKSVYEFDPMHVDEAWQTLYSREWDETDRYLAANILRQFRADLPGGRHTALMHALTWGCKSAWAGKLDPLPLIATIRREFLDAVDGARDAGLAEIEFSRAVLFAVQTAEAEALALPAETSKPESAADGTVSVGEWIAQTLASLETVERETELIADTLPPIGVGQLVGVTYVGKSYLAVDLACSLATESVKTWFGRQILQHGGVAYWLLEGSWDFGLRTRAWRQHHGVTQTDHPIYVLQGPGRVTVPEQQERLISVTRSAFAGERLALLVIDTQSLAFCELNEQDNTEMNRMVSACKTISEALRCPVMLVHHASDKGEGGPNRKDPGRGASSQRAGMDFVLYAERPAADPGGEPAPGKLALDKYKPYKPWGSAELYIFQAVDLGHDVNGRPLASAVVLHETDTPAGKYRGTPVSEAHAVADRAIIQAVGDNPGQKISAYAAPLAGLPLALVKNRVRQYLVPHEHLRVTQGVSPTRLEVGPEPYPSP
jgi:hypothetical protein